MATQKGVIVSQLVIATVPNRAEVKELHARLSNDLSAVMAQVEGIIDAIAGVTGKPASKPTFGGRLVVMCTTPQYPGKRLNISVNVHRVRTESGRSDVYIVDGMIGKSMVTIRCDYSNNRAILTVLKLTRH